MGRVALCLWPHIPAGPTPVPTLPLSCFGAFDKSLSFPEPQVTFWKRARKASLPVPTHRPSSPLVRSALPHSLFHRTLSSDLPRGLCNSLLLPPGTFFFRLNLHFLESLLHDTSSERPPGPPQSKQSLLRTLHLFTGFYGFSTARSHPCSQHIFPWCLAVVGVGTEQRIEQTIADCPSQGVHSGG